MSCVVCGRCACAAETSRAEHAAAIKRAEEAEARVLDPTPYEGPATGDDLIDRLRGIYVSPLPDGERRFGSSRVNREAAAEIERLREWQSEADIAIKRPEPSEHAAALGLATARIRELEGERDELLDFTRIIASMNLPWWTREARAIVARIEKATKGTT